MMKGKVIIHILMLIALLLCRAEVYAEGEGEDFESVLNDYAEFYGDVFEEGLGDIDGENSFLEMVPEFKPSDILKQLNKGELSLTPGQVLKYLLKLLLGEVYSGAKLMAIILAMSVLSSYLSNLGSGFASDSVAKAAFYVCYIVMAGTAAAAFYETASCASQAIENIAGFVKVVVPAIITILYTSGAIISASVLEPVVLGIVGIAVPAVQSAFIPAVMISTGLNVVNGMSDKFKTDRMVKLINNAVKWGLSVMLTIFVSLAGLKSIASAGADGLSVKLSKFATSNLVPIVGGILAESVETVMNCSVVIKNSIGILGIVCLILIALGPILRMGAMLIIFRITAAIAEPVSEPKIITCISRLADSVAVLFSILVAVTIMFIIVVTIIINAGNSAVMLGG